MSKQYSDSIALAAQSIVQSSGVDITQPVTILPLAKTLMAETGCSIDTAKRHIAKAVRLARGELTTSPAWGGLRTPAGGRPTMSAKLSTRMWEALPPHLQIQIAGSGNMFLSSYPGPAHYFEHAYAHACRGDEETALRYIREGMFFRFFEHWDELARYWEQFL